MGRSLTRARRVALTFVTRQGRRARGGPAMKPFDYLKEP
jgi:hypothetical protein